MTVTAKIIADSISPQGKRITTFELVYPRIVHSEFMTHRLFSRNAASSRAIPVKAMLETIRTDTAKPVSWGKNQAGMQAAGDHDALINGYTPDEWWNLAALSASRFAEDFAEAGYHKQVANRLVEAFSHIKVVLTATSYDNWFWLRDHKDADPTINALAVVMWDALQNSEAIELAPGAWHVPYYQNGYWIESELTPGLDAFGSSLDDALKISSSCTAQVSYRKNDDSLEKAQAVFARLVESAPVHASPTEHQATPMKKPVWRATAEEKAVFEWEPGVTHMTCEGNFGSGNFEGWIQHRQLIPNHDCKHYEK